MSTTTAPATAPNGGGTKACASATDATLNASAPASANENGNSGGGLDGMPGWLQPGVSQGIHFGLRVVLLFLNGWLFICAALQLFSPHFEIMFLMSLSLTACYIWFCWEMGKIGLEEKEKESSKQAEEGDEIKTEQKKEK